MLPLDPPELRGRKEEAFRRRKRADDEAQGSNGGKIDSGPARRLGIATYGIDVTPELRALEDHHPCAEDSQDDGDDPGYARQCADRGSIYIADPHHAGREDRDQDDLDQG